MNNYYLNVHEIMEITGRKEAWCYQLIKKMNEELKKKGFITTRGKVPRKYFNERMGLDQ
ncbi:transcriptional regulator [Peptostreptococcus faecalis]|uniref:transcriptional regulator n=1 Tax=Peptostreptococcus faecalis TaxID=2045015 RepID=UPI000C7A91A7|nr:transcriptional regulator [Peptostreptococcus faecalis]